MGVNDPKTFLKARVQKYLDNLNDARATDAQRWVIEATMKYAATHELTMDVMPGVEGQDISEMLIGIGQAHFITMHAKNLGRAHNGPMKMLDDGTFTGLSAGAMALAIAENGNGGTVITCDIKDIYLPTAQAYWEKEGIDDYISPRIAPGGTLEIMKQLLADPNEHGTFDLIHLDGNKLDYAACYDLALSLLRPGGQIMLDNMLWSGRVAFTQDMPAEELKAAHINTTMLQAILEDEKRNALLDLNACIIKDPRVDAFLLDCFDGVMIAEKRRAPQMAHKWEPLHHR